MDDGSIPRFIIIILLLFAGSAYFAGAEMSLASVNRIRMMSYADDGNRRAKKVIYILDNFDKALSTLLIGNNVMHISCASVVTLMASKLWGNAYITAASFVTSFAVFVFAEMIPKAYAKACNETFALAVSGSLVVLMKLLTPVTFAFTKLSDAAREPFKTDEEETPTVTEEELFDIIENIDGEDEIDEDTTELMQSALEFTETVIKDIYTPWDKVALIRTDMTYEQVADVARENHFSRFPVTYPDGRLAGVLQIRRYLKEYLTGNKKPDIRSLLDRALFVSSTMPIDEQLSYMSQHRTHLAIVRGDESKILGIVTVEDILEELVGEIYDEEDAGGEGR